ncbi:DUF1574 domain-containing protein [Stenomitos frigidus]|uniref:DUF1574 domain-containing protein n=1 Tax=Stenomitos frigidus ULC18 TaxID=2107698 RepID=A0A2T1ENU7_9CYAN|nr:DUF1574 domain-containing protein [Stenomitos frigidus]PSB34338.1 DUF1574 domain-containing protein [Stenomitos frigidus ULC18]
MLDVHGHNPPSARKQGCLGGSGTSLDDWIHQRVKVPHLQVKSKLRGNNLHLLFEGTPCPDRAVIMPPLTEALSAMALTPLLPPQSPPVYRIIAYGRLLQQAQPEWTEAFVPHPDQPPHAQQARTTATPPLAEVAGTTPQECNIEAASIHTLSAARQGQPEAIARHLSDAFSTLGVAVRVKLEKPQKPPQETPSSATPHSPLPTPTPLKRLLIACESAYSPDPLLFAEPIAQRLRALELNGFQDALVFGQVAGETRTEWVLRVDLTPPEDILKTWAHWGDVQAITRLLNRTLLSEKVQTSALLKEATLHLTCRSTQSATPDKLTTIAAIVPLLETLSPQGIRAATIYGFAHQESSTNLLSATATPAPVWVHWLDLSPDPQPLSTFDLAQKGNLDAIAFLLTRMLNPDLDRKLGTGGIRVQVRQKADLLHIMGEAPLCPLQSQMGVAIARFLKPLQIPTIAGVRIYGRRSGQKQPLWSYGVDFSARDRLVPEATPEFAVSDAYVGDLLSPPGALALRTEEASEASRSFLSTIVASAIQRVQRSLIWSQLFVPLDSAQLGSNLTYSSDLTDLTAKRSVKVAAVWSAIGVLLVVQSDWLLNRWLQAPPPAPIAASQPSPAVVPPPAGSLFPALSINPGKAHDKSAFNASGFTQPGTSSASPVEGAPAAETVASTTLPASPLRPKADGLTKGSEAYPTFNSRQLDEKVALYQSYLKEYGTPDVLIIGSSRALRGVDPIALQKALADQGYAGTKSFNFGVNGATAQVVDMIVRQLLPQEKLPKLILWADGARAFNSGRADVTYNGIVASDGYKALAAGNPPIPGTAVAQVTGGTKRPEPASTTSVTEDPPTSLSGGYQTVNQELNRRLGTFSALYSQRDHLRVFLRDGLVSLLPHSLSKVVSGSAIASNNLSDATSPGAAAANAPASVLAEGQSAVDIDGFLPLPNQFNPATYYQKYARVNGDYDSDYDSFSLEGTQTQALTNLAQFSQTHQIPLIFVNLPLTNDYLDPTRKRHEEDFQQDMLRRATQLGFIYRDLSQALANQPDRFSDPSHLNRYGAYAVSHQLAGDVMIPWSQARR